jgi:hypothetical protein
VLRERAIEANEDFNMASVSEENKIIKMEFINAFFDGLDNKADYLIELYQAGRRYEARILCACYLDGLASALCWPDERSNYNYVKILKEHGGNEVFGCIHPKMLDEALVKLSKRGKKWKTIHESIAGTLMAAEGHLYKEKEIIEMVAPLLKSTQVELIKNELWRGSFAAIVYDQFRVAAVHSFGPPGTTFSNTTFKGKPVPQIDFSMVRDCLRRITDVARARSEKSCKWFGHDYE